MGDMQQHGPAKAVRSDKKSLEGAQRETVSSVHIHTPIGEMLSPMVGLSGPCLETLSEEDTLGEIHQPTATVTPEALKAVRAFLKMRYGSDQNSSLSFTGKDAENHLDITYLEVLHQLAPFQDANQISREALRLSEGDTLFDFGGSFCPDMADVKNEIGPEGRLLLADLNPLATRAAEQEAQKLSWRASVETYTGDAIKYLEKLPPHSVDGLRSLRVFQHCQPDVVDMALAGAKKAVKPGGRICSIDPVWAGGSELWPIPGSRKALTKLGKGSVAYPEIAETIRSHYEQAGFVEIELQKLHFSFQEPAVIKYLMNIPGAIKKSAPSYLQGSLNVLADIALATRMLKLSGQLVIATASVPEK